MGARNEKGKSGRKRGEAQSGSAAAPARPRRVLLGLRIILGGEFGQDVCLLLGVPSEARDALPRRQPRQGTAGAHLYNITSTRLMINRGISSVLNGLKRESFAGEPLSALPAFGTTFSLFYGGFSLIEICVCKDPVICAVRRA